MQASSDKKKGPDAIHRARAGLPEGLASALPCAGTALWFVFLAVTLTWPLALHLRENFYGNEGTTDLSLFLWNLWWVREAVLQGTNPLYTAVLHHPTGISLAYHTLSLPQGLLALPWTLTGNYLLAYNVVALTSLASSGLAMTLLARSITRAWIPAVLAGTYFVLAPNYVVHAASAHLNLISWQWALLACWAFLRLLSSPRPWPWAVALGILSALSIYTDLLFGIFLALLLPALYLATQGLTLPKATSLPPLAAAAALTFLLLLPLTIGLVRGYQDVAASAPWVAPQERLALHSPDLSYFFLPKGGTDGGLVLYRQFLPPDLVIPPKGAENRAFIGLIPAGLALAGIIRRPTLWPLAALGLASALLSLGPSLRFAGSDLAPNPLFQAFHAVPGMAISRTPGRFLFLVTASLAILASSALSSRDSPKRLQPPRHKAPFSPVPRT